MMTCQRILKTGGLINGMSIGNWHPNADVGLNLDVERFFDLLIETLATYP
jgi:hypothetical protein